VRPRAAQLRDASNGLRTPATWWLRDVVDDGAARVAAPRIVVVVVVVVVVIIVKCAPMEARGRRVRRRRGRVFRTTEKFLPRPYQ
jgi:hypothetical protein